MTKDKSRDAGMAMVLLLLILYGAFKHKSILLSAIMVHVLNMIWPRVYAPVAVVWFGLSDLLGAVVSKVVLAVLFFGVITPIGVLRRLAGKDSLKLRAFKAGPESVMVQRDHMFSAKDIEKPY